MKVGENHWSFSEMKILGGFRSLLSANRLVQHRCIEETAAQCGSGNASMVQRLEHHDQDGKVDVRQKLIDNRNGTVARTLRFWVQDYDVDVGPELSGRRQKLFAVLKGRILYGGGDRDDGTTWDEEIVGVYADIAAAERSAETCCHSGGACSPEENGEQTGTGAGTMGEVASEGGGQRREQICSPSTAASEPGRRRRREGGRSEGMEVSSGDAATWY